MIDCTNFCDEPHSIFSTEEEIHLADGAERARQGSRASERILIELISHPLATSVCGGVLLVALLCCLVKAIRTAVCLSWKTDEADAMPQPTPQEGAARTPNNGEDDLIFSNGLTPRAITSTGATAAKHNLAVPDSKASKPNGEREDRAKNGGNNGPGTIRTTEESFEGAITRLAAAVGLGTEQLVYVRRIDVAEVVDALLRQAEAPGGLSVTSPALARLAIVRRSARRGSKGRSKSLVPDVSAISRSYFDDTIGPQSRDFLTGARNLSTLFDVDHANWTTETRTRKPPLSPRPRPPPTSPVPIAITERSNDNGNRDKCVAIPAQCAMPGDASNATEVPPFPRPTSKSACLCGPPLPSTISAADDAIASRRCTRTGWVGGEQWRSRQFRSPPPSPSPSNCATTVAGNLVASPTGRASPCGLSRAYGSPVNGSPRSHRVSAGDRTSHNAVRSAVGTSGGPPTSLRASPALARAQSRMEVYTAAAAATKLENSNKNTASSAERSSSTMVTSPPEASGESNSTISFVPITPRAADETGAGARAFDDFWSSGWVD